MWALAAQLLVEGVLGDLGGQEIVGILGGLGAAGGAVAWVVRVENDLLSKYRIRVAELQQDLREVEDERDTWRDRYYRLVHAAVSKGIAPAELGINLVPPAGPPEAPPAP